MTELKNWLKGGETTMSAQTPVVMKPEPAHWRCRVFGWHIWLEVRTEHDFKICERLFGDRFAVGLVDVSYPRGVFVCTRGGCDAVQDDVAAFERDILQRVREAAREHAVAVRKAERLLGAGVSGGGFEYLKTKTARFESALRGHQ